MVLDVNVLTSGWAIAGVIASFCVAFAAVVFGIISNIQLKKITVKEQRERKLYRVIDWVNDVLLFRRKAEQMVMQFPNNSVFEFDLRTVNELRVKGKSIESIAYTINKDLGDAVSNLRKLLKQHSELLRSRWKGEVSDTSSIDDHRKIVDAAAEETIELTAKLF